MTAGLPGTGIGGLFYILLAFLMPIYECIQLVRGRSSLKRWKMVVFQVGNAVGVLASLYAMSWLIRHTLGAIINQNFSFFAERTAVVQQIHSVTSVTVAWLTVAILAAVTTGVLFLRAAIPLMSRFHRLALAPVLNRNRALKK